MPHRIRDCTRRAGDPDFAHAFDAESIDVRVAFLNQDRFDRGHVGVHRDMVFGQIGVHRTAGPRVHDGVLVECERDTPNHSAAELAAHHARIDDPSYSERTEHAGDTHLPEIGIYLDLGEHRTMRMHGVDRLGGLVGRACSVTLDLCKPGAAEKIRVASSPTRWLNEQLRKLPLRHI